MSSPGGGGPAGPPPPGVVAPGGDPLGAPVPGCAITFCNFRAEPRRQIDLRFAERRSRLVANFCTKTQKIANK